MIVWIVLLLLLPINAEAATLYVNATGGDDSRSYATAQTEGTPWATIERAAWGSNSYGSPNTSAAAQAGDTVLIAAGTYSVSGGPTASVNQTVILNPANSGSSGNLITFRGVGTVEIRTNTGGQRGAMIGCDNRSYIVWDHFVIDDTYGSSLSDRGPVAFHAEAHHCQIINSTIRGHNGLTAYANGDATFEGNYRLVSFEDANNNLVKNNSISRALDPGGAPGGQNQGCILLYDSDDNTFEHNEIDDCGAGIFVKGAHAPETQSGNIIRYNRITNSFHGIRILTGDDALIYQNIIGGCRAAEGAAGLYAGNGEAIRSKWINNTVYNCDRAIVIHEGVPTAGQAVIDVEYHNNLIVTAASGLYNWNTGSLAAIDASWTRNFWYDIDTHAQGEGWGSVSFATWQSGGRDTNGVNGTDPQFTNAAGGDFHIANATALTTGRVVESIGGTNGDTIPVGAYITGNEEIGIESGVSATASSTVSGGVTFSGSVRIQ